MARKRRRHHVLPGFGLTLGFTTFYLSVLTVIPLALLFLRFSGVSWADFKETIFEPRVLAAFRLTFGASFLAALTNAVFGFLVAWVLVRYSFRGKRVIDAIVDLPFALPTAVSGITLTALYAPTGWIGRYLPFEVSYTAIGIYIALTFIGLPFVVRAMQPALEEVDKELEEVSASLGATRWQTFWKVIFPTVAPSLLAGFTMAFARAIGEYGSVVFIAGNMQGKTEILPLIIFYKLGEHDYTGATTVAVSMLVASFALLFFINMIQLWGSRYKDEEN
ncbi:MAG: sulfate ABC transporter permease subunit CysT [Thermoguttaceae bacterium]|nr:sulfate ABC transporter permease subunit CysT [Thermoguttaceae bacterium]